MSPQALVVRSEIETLVKLSEVVMSKQELVGILKSVLNDLEDVPSLLQEYGHLVAREVM